MGKQTSFNTNMTKQSRLEQSACQCWGFRSKPQCWQEQERPLREICSLSSYLMFLSCTLLLPNRLSHINNLSSEEGEKQFPFPVLLNTHLFLNRFVMPPFAMRNGQSKNTTKQFIAHWLYIWALFSDQGRFVPPTSLSVGKPAAVLPAGKGWSHTRLHDSCLCIAEMLEASGVQSPCLQMCQAALPPALQGGAPGGTPKCSSSRYTSRKAGE